MYGHYSELQQFAREFAASRSRSQQTHQGQQPTDVEEARRRKSKAWRTWRYIQMKILPYIIDWLFILILGVLMATLSFIIDVFIDWISKAHVVLSIQLLSDTHALVQYLFWVAYPVLFILFSVGFVQVVSIHAIGSGIPEMKTVLRGIYLQDYLTFKTFISKAVSLVTAVGSSMPIGKEGPFVHLSSIIAHFMSKFITTINRVYANEAHNNELLAAACAVGVSCNFAAPIGGVLFSIEVTTTYFAVRNYWRGFFGAVCGAFLFRLGAVWFKDEETITALFKTSFRPDFPFDLEELLAFALIGVVAGFFGAFFVWVHRNYVLLRRRFRKYTKFLERHIFIYPAVVTILFTSLTFPLGLGRFMAGELSQRGAIDQLFSNLTWSRDLPTPGEIEDVPEDSEAFQLARQWSTPNIYFTLLLFIFVRFIFSVLANSLPIPTGVFFPVFVLGAAFGRLIGEVMAVSFPNGVGGAEVSPGGYAVVGAAAMAGSVTHTISTSVIVFELTGQITHILPVMIAVLIANALASLLQPSFYDSIIFLKQLSYLPDLKPNKYYNLYATDIMRRDLVYLSYCSTYADLQQMLSRSNHASYPLVDAPDSRILIGSVSRHYLKTMLDEQLKGVYEHAQQILEHQRSEPEDSAVESSLQSTPVHSSPPERTPSPSNRDMLSRISSVPQSLARLFGGQEETDSPGLQALQELDEQRSQIDPASEDNQDIEALDQLRDELLSKTIDFKRSHIDPAPFQLVERTSLYKIHSLFTILALSHAYVTSIGRLVGVVTLADLSDAIEGRKKPSQPMDAAMLEMLNMADPEEEESREEESRLAHARVDPLGQL